MQGFCDVCGLHVFVQVAVAVVGHPPGGAAFSLCVDGVCISVVTLNPCAGISFQLPVSFLRRHFHTMIVLLLEPKVIILFHGYLNTTLTTPHVR